MSTRHSVKPSFDLSYLFLPKKWVDYTVRLFTKKTRETVTELVTAVGNRDCDETFEKSVN